MTALAARAEANCIPVRGRVAALPGLQGSIVSLTGMLTAGRTVQGNGRGRSGQVLLVFIRDNLPVLTFSSF